MRILTKIIHFNTMKQDIFDFVYIVWYLLSMFCIEINIFFSLVISKVVRKIHNPQMEHICSGCPSFQAIDDCKDIKGGFFN